MKVFMEEAGPLAATDVVIGAGELWAPYRELYSIVIEAISRPSPVTIEELDAALRRHRPDIINIFKLRPRSPADREELRKAGGEGLAIRGQDKKQALSQAIVAETLLLSDIFDINEFHALDLLVTAANELENYPNWGRGILAVYFFFEGRSLLIQCILAMLEIVSGATWTSRANPKVTELSERILTDFFAQDDLMDRLIKVLDKSNVKNQMELLETNLALGDWRHRSEIYKFATSIRLGLSNIIFCWSAQRGLGWKPTSRLLDYIRTRFTTREEFKPSKDDVLLLFSILYSIDYATSIQQVDRDYFTQVKKYCSDQEAVHGFEFEEILDLIRLTCILNIFKLTSLIRITSIQPANDPTSLLLRDDEEFEFKKDLFSFLKTYLLSDPTLFSPEEHLMRRIHQLFTDFIQYMPMKLKDLKNRSEDGAKTAFIFQEQGLPLPTNLPQDYENFLECLGSFYTQDKSLQLAEDFFTQDFQLASLNKVIRATSVDPPTMFIPNVKMLSGMAVSYPSGVFNFINQNGHNVSLEHFFESLSKYLESFGAQERNVPAQGHHHHSVAQFPQFGGGMGDQRSSTSANVKSVNPNEIKGICSYLDLVQVLGQNCGPARDYFTTTRIQWLRIALSAVKCFLPREVRGKALRTAASMIARDYHSPEHITILWNMLYNEKLIDDKSPSDLQIELMDHETRLEVYPITISLLHLIDALVDTRFTRREEEEMDHESNPDIDDGAFEPYLRFVTEFVLLKASFRPYKNMGERWEMITLSVGILSKLLDFVPTIVVQMLSDSPLVRTILNVIVECAKLRELSLTPNSYIDNCSLQCLSLIQRVLKRQPTILCKKDYITEKKSRVLIGLHDVILKLSSAGKPDSMRAILKFIDILSPESHRQLALEILSMLLMGHSETDIKIYRVLFTDPTLGDILKHTFISILYDIGMSEENKVAVLQIIRSSINHESPNVAQYILCVDKKVDFQNPGVNDYPKTIIHALLDRCFSLPDSFLTLLALICDKNLSENLLRYLRTNQIFVKFLHEDLQLSEMSNKGLGNFLKCMAIELKTAPIPGGPLARTLLSSSNFKFSEILERINFNDSDSELPKLEFFDLTLVVEAMKKCERYNKDIGRKLINIELLDGILRSEIAKLEKTTTLRLRKNVHVEANELIAFATKINEKNIKDSTKVLLYDGWRQCLETLCFTSIPEKLIRSEFITSIIRLLLEKVVESQNASDAFLRLCSETVAVLSAILATFSSSSSSKDGGSLPTPTLHIIMKSICTWVSRELSHGVRAQLFASLLYIVKLIKEQAPSHSDLGGPFNLILEPLCKDACQGTTELGRIMAMHLLGENVYWAGSRGLAGIERISEKSSLDKSIFDMSGGDSLLSGTRKEFSWAISKDLGGLGLYDQSRTESVIKFMHTKGFLRLIVDTLPTSDNSELIAYFTKHPVPTENVQPLLTFEAKMTLLTRFANSGPRASSNLINVNAIDRLIDMTVFEMTYFQEAESSLLREINFMRDFTNPLETSPFSILTRMDLLFYGPLMFFHAMLNSNPKNLYILEQIVNFISAHDLVLSNLLSETILKYTDNNFHSSQLLLALLARLALALPPQAFDRWTWISVKLVKILRNQALEKNSSEYRLRIIRSVIQFYLNHSKGADVVEPLGRDRKRRKWTCRPVLEPRVSLSDSNEFLESADGDVTVGVVLKVIMDMTEHLSATTTGNVLAILEMGLTIVYFHVEIYLSSNHPMAVILDPETKVSFKKELADFLGGVYFRNACENIKNFSGNEYSLSLLGRLKRLANLPEDESNSLQF